MTQTLLSSKLMSGKSQMCQSCGDSYEIRLKEPLDPSWSEWFDDFTITTSEGGETKIEGLIRDQTALHGLLAKIRDLNLTLISVQKTAPGGETGQEKNGEGYHSTLEIPMSVYLERVIVNFPNTDTEFTNNLLSLVNVLGQYGDHILELTGSGERFYPKLSLDFQSGDADVLTDFFLSDGEVISVKVENATGQSKQNPHPYTHLDVETVKQRFVTSGISLIEIDHVGFNLPWFSSDVHPRILQLRKQLSSRCLYHRFPTGEPWDFIIPGDIDEILNRKPVDYSKVRRPKFELVSFNNASTPLIQFDISVNAPYERFLELFPESLNDPELRNVWLYLASPYTVDVCLVINEFSDHDWSDFFNGCRL